MEELVVYNGAQSHILVQKQLEDVILTQQAAYDKLKQSVDTEHMVSGKQYEAVFQMLEEERAAHGETKSKLLDTQDKLAFCQGEVEVLARQIDREKMQFDQTFGLLKTKALTETVKNIELENKCHEIEKQSEERRDVLSDKDHQIEALTRRLQSQREHYERRLSELTIQMKQEAYIAQTLVDSNAGHKT
ncbi:Spermatogenesis-associated protein 24 [Lamellibrachia satsuma]|nr:Spermatogenesis-associated protein 24 [Lamellibrachia satsuma]